MAPNLMKKPASKLNNKIFKKTKMKKLGSKQLKSGGIKIDRKGEKTAGKQEEGKNKMSRKAKKKEALAYKKMMEREKELALDLFGFDDEDDDDKTTTTTTPATTIPTISKKNVKKMKVKKKQKKEENMIPDDPYDIHGIPEKKERRPAWVDDDDVIKVKDVEAMRKKKKGSTGVRETSEQQYSETLKKKFSQVIGGTPEWASLDRKYDDDDDDKLTLSTGDYLSKKKGGALEKSHLRYRNVMNLNDKSRTEGAFIRVVEFNSRLPMALVAGYSYEHGSATLFRVDGITNHKIQSVRFPDYQVRCAKFLGDGKRILLSASNDPNFCCYNMETSQILHFPANLRSWNRGIKKFAVTPDGSLIVTLAPSGMMDVFDGRGLSHIHTFYAPEDVYSIAFNDNGSRMYSHGVGGDVCVWDMDARQCVHRFYDDGCITGTSVALSGCYLATGSSSGIVNIYDTSQLISNPTPAPVKVLSRLLTSISALAFNSSTEILATVSDKKEDAFKLVHFPSMTYFENFPLNNKVGRIQMVNFSPQSGFLAFGNDRGRSRLFRLEHYDSY